MVVVVVVLLVLLALILLLAPFLRVPLVLVLTLFLLDDVLWFFW